MDDVIVQPPAEQYAVVIQTVIHPRTGHVAQLVACPFCDVMTVMPLHGWSYTCWSCLRWFAVKTQLPACPGCERDLANQQGHMGPKEEGYCIPSNEELEQLLVGELLRAPEVDPRVAPSPPPRPAEPVAAQLEAASAGHQKVE